MFAIPLQSIFIIINSCIVFIIFEHTCQFAVVQYCALLSLSWALQCFTYLLHYHQIVVATVYDNSSFPFHFGHFAKCCSNGSNCVHINSSAAYGMKSAATTIAPKKTMLWMNENVFGKRPFVWTGIISISFDGVSLGISQALRMHSGYANAPTSTTCKGPTKTNHSTWICMHSHMHQEMNKISMSKNDEKRQQNIEQHIRNKIGRRQINFWPCKKCRWCLLCCGFMPRLCMAEHWHIANSVEWTNTLDFSNMLDLHTHTRIYWRSLAREHEWVAFAKEAKIYRCIFCVSLPFSLVLLRFRDSMARCHYCNICCCQRNQNSLTATTQTNEFAVWIIKKRKQYTSTANLQCARSKPKNIVV